MSQEVRSRAGTQTQESAPEKVLFTFSEHLSIILEGHTIEFIVMTFGQWD